MTTNPLSGGGFGRGPFADMAIGETRTFTPNKETAGPPITLTRTKRPFVEDWVDAVNATIPSGRGLVWSVDSADIPQLGAARFLRASRPTLQSRPMIASTAKALRHG